MYSVDWDHFLNAQIPAWWRRPLLLAWLRVLLSPVVYLYDRYQTYRSGTIYHMRVTPQVCMLELLLNDRFDPVFRRIWIESIFDPQDNYLFQVSEDRPPVWHYNRWDATYMYAEGEYAAWAGRVWVSLTEHSDSEPMIGSDDWSEHTEPWPYLKNRAEGWLVVDFIVWVPIELSYDDQLMRALMIRYKQAGKRFQIMTY